MYGTYYIVVPEYLWCPMNYYRGDELNYGYVINLIPYLQELHKLKLANEDHTTLLLNCYTKLKDEARLNAFLLQHNVEFDVDTAIKVLRQSGYYKQALQLCDKHRRHEDYLKIQLENLHAYAEALAYIERLDEGSAVLNVKRYGKLLMANIPEETGVFLKSLCSKTDRKSIWCLAFGMLYFTH